jgi:3-hydroxybutyryl-CoA dehydrogenase
VSDARILAQQGSDQRTRPRAIIPTMEAIFSQVGIAGAGAMGRGIAQLAVQAGSIVWLFDTQAQASVSARDAVFSQWDKLVDKGRLDAAQAADYKVRLHCADGLAALSGCTLVVEAIVERLEVKVGLFTQLEALLAPSAVLASNTSSLSITALGAALQRPQQLAGFHFFNPVPLMKVVEVIAGLKTDLGVCEALVAFARQMGHTPVRAQDTPGFIVNHAGRGYGTEALRLVSEGVTDFATADRILKDQVGFKLGPFELMDLTALDVSHPVMESVYRQYYEEPRYRPSVITAQRLVACWAARLAKGFTATRKAWRKSVRRQLHP